MTKQLNQQGESRSRTVTSAGRRPGTPAAERKRQQRERERNLIYETEDWRLFTDLATLPQKAGCQPAYLGEVVLKELVDNALDTGANVSLDHIDDTWIVADDGPGLDPADVPRLFSVNRPLLSSELKRLPLRGMLGNGLRVVVGAVAATNGTLVVESRGHSLTLAMCHQSGRTTVTLDELVPLRPGVTVRLSIGPRDPTDDRLASGSIAISRCGVVYTGPSSPWWYGGKDLHKLFVQVTPANTTVGAICRSLGLDLDDDRPAPTLNRDDAETVLGLLRRKSQPVPPEKLGYIGRAGRPTLPGYAREADFTATQAGAHIPYVVEAWAICERPKQRGQGSVDITVLINRSMTVATIHAASASRFLVLQGCGLDRRVNGPGIGDYEIYLSIIAPHIQLATDGKEPSLAPFGEAIARVLRIACGSAHKAMHRTDGGVSIKDAAWSVMDKAYRVASGGERRLPANARQVMYAARPAILQMTGKSKLDDAYFTQTLLPDFIAEHGKGTEWDVVFDSRGSFVEPHTGHQVALGTLGVRDYLVAHSFPEVAVDATSRARYPTKGPNNRYAAVLFIEKEGFAPLLEAARIADRFDIAIMSTKGMSTTAARMLLDRLAPQINRILVLHDFDVSGFSISGTLSADGRRYRFDNDLPIADIGLRLADVEMMKLESEAVETQGSWKSRSRTLTEHGATPTEIAFLQNRRVELNAMAADVFVDFLEQKLAEHCIRKVVPERNILECHARRVIEQGLTQKLLDTNKTAMQMEASLAALPANLDAQVRSILTSRPDLSWDDAVAGLLRGGVG
jgi:Protein of unknown function C-terminus (DUF2399)